ncbi:MAG: O-antigen ligase family protein [Succinivibrionaceae bacterium]
MVKRNFLIPFFIYVFISFISISVGNVFLGVSVACCLVYVYLNREKISFYNFDSNKCIKIIYILLGFFALSFLFSILNSKHIGKSIETWFNYFVWRPLPFYITTFFVLNIKGIKLLFKSLLLGVLVSILYANIQGFCGQARANAFFGYPMTLAGFLSMLLPVSLVLFFDYKLLGKKWAFFAFSVFLLGFFALLYNGTRGAWIGCGVSFAVVFVYYMFSSIKKFIATFIIICSLSGCVLLNSSVVDRIKTINISSTEQSFTERKLLWKSAYEMFKDYPITGIGLKQFREIYSVKYISPMAKEPGLKHAHNNFLHILAETGILGTLGFVVFFGYILLSSLYRALRYKCSISLMIFVSTLSIEIQGLTEYNFGNSAVTKTYWLLLGMLLVFRLYLKNTIKDDIVKDGIIKDDIINDNIIKNKTF